MRPWPSASLLALPLLAALVAGCLQSGGPADRPSAPAAADPWPAIQAEMQGVPCEATVGGDTSPNLKLLANVSYGEEAGQHGEVDIAGHLLLHARFQTGGFDLVDIADPLHPVPLGAFQLDDEASGALDVKFSPDNQTALYGTRAGIVLVDVRDPRLPHLVGQWNRTGGTLPPLPVDQWNAHMLFTARIADRDWVFVAPNTGTGVWVLEMTGTPDARGLRYVTQTMAVEGGPLGPHDMYVQKDEKDGHWYLYSADGFEGWTVFNVDDPAHPERVGGMANPAEGAYTHTVQAAWVNGRRLVATIAEIGANALKVYDATDLDSPVLLGAWQADPGRGSAAAEHNFNIVGGRLFMSHYSRGMYILDLNQLGGTPLAGTLQMAPEAHWGDNGELGTGTTDVWDTVLQDGLLYLGDMNGGLYVLGYGCHAAPDPALTSTG